MSTSIRAALAATATTIALTLSSSASAAQPGYSHYWGHSQPVQIYFTRHAEKQTELEDLGDGLFEELCGVSKCAEELNAKGKLRAELLADWFARRCITYRITHALSSHKQRTRQNIELIASEAGLDNDIDLIEDGVQQLPADGIELAPESTSPSEAPTIEALQNLPSGSVAIVAGHSGTLYDIMEGLGLDTSDAADFPRKDDGKVRDFGDIWKVTLRGDRVRLNFRKNLQPTRLRVVD